MSSGGIIRLFVDAEVQAAITRSSKRIASPLAMLTPSGKP